MMSAERVDGIDSPAPRAPPPALDLGQKSIRAQLALLVLGIAVPAFVLAVVYLARQRDEAREIGRDKVAILADAAAARLAGKLREHELLLTHIAGLPFVQAMDPSKCELSIQDFVRLYPEYVGMGTRDMQGNLVCSYRKQAPSRQLMLTYPWFNRSLQAGRFQVSDAFFLPLARVWTVMLTMPVRDHSGLQLGVVILPVDLLRLNQLVLAGTPADTLVTVTDGDYKILLRSSEPDRWIGQPAPAAVQSTLRSLPQGFTNATGIDGIERLVAFRPLAGTPWRVSAGVPTTAVFGAADADLRNGVLACVLLLLGALVAAWRLARSMVRPLDALVATAARVTGGDMSARVPAITGAPEFVALAAAINQMLDARRAAESALRRNEEKLSITLDSIGDGMIATDAAGCITRMNPVAERLTGWSLADAHGRELREVFRIIDSDTGLPLSDPVQQVLASGNTVGMASHTALVARDDRRYQISDSAAPIRDGAGQVVGVVLVFSDVSQAYALQRAVSESENRYRALVESSPVGVAVHQDGRLTYANPMALKIIGASHPDDILGRNFIDFIHAPDRAVALERATQMVEHGANLPAVEVRYIRLDGRLVEVQAQGIPVQLNGRRAVQVSMMDITERKQAERRLRENEERFRALTELSSDWYWEQDERFRFVRLDGNLAETSGRTIGSIAGKTRWEVPGHDVPAAQWEQHRATLDAHLPFRDFQMHNHDLQGHDRWVSISGAPIFDAAGAFRGYRGVGRDVTAEKIAADQIHALAFFDALTELPNRRLLIEQLKKALLAHARTHRQAALLFIDLDNFKTLNDTLGHETGDLLLRQVARRLVETVREADVVARLGGDEFVVMLEDLSEDLQEAAVQAEAIGHKILLAFATGFELGGRAYGSTPSIGITLFGKGGQAVDDLLKHADLAMYHAKGSGRNTLRMFDQGMQAAVDARAALESELRDALAGGQMRLAYQPVMQKDGVVSGAEALLRWEHPARGLVSPGEFIPLAESTRLIIPLGQWVLRTACEQLAAWAALPHMAPLTLAVNVSAHQFKEPDFADQVLQAVRHSGADPHRLKLELTESLLADNVEDIIDKMTVLRALGIDFSLDDFGTGYSSLSYLKRLPLSQLKIDQSFVRDVLVDPNDAAIARTIVALGGSLGLAIVAEGVETTGQHQFLQSIGCHAFQGYLFGRPMALADLDRFVLEHAQARIARAL